VVRERGLRDVEQRHELAHADLPGVLTQDIDELQADRIAEGLRHLGHADRLLALHVRVDDGSQQRSPAGRFVLGVNARSMLINPRIPIEVMIVNAI